MGAIATLIDNVGAATIYSSIGVAKVSVELNISYYSTAKIQVCSLILSYLILSYLIFVQSLIHFFFFFFFSFLSNTLQQIVTTFSHVRQVFISC